MSADNFRRRTRCSRLLASAAAAALAIQPVQAKEAIQEVMVTGSRLPQPDPVGSGAVLSIDAGRISIEGVTRIEDLINKLPQAFAAQGGNLANGATGTASVNLRNLGVKRTMVLVNGRRLMPGDPTRNGSAAADLNQIPAALLERIEVLSGGASAVHGADAVAGVVNFIMRDEFEGLRVDAHYGMYRHRNDSGIASLVKDSGFAAPGGNISDGDTKDITLIAGINTADGRGNAIVYLGYRKLAAITQDRRDFSAYGLSSGDAFACGGSATTAPAAIFTYDHRNDAHDFDPTGYYQVGPGGILEDFTKVYNFAPSNYFQRPDERNSAGMFGHHDLSERSSIYGEFMFMDDRTAAQIAPSGAFLGGGPSQPPFFGRYAVNCDNPLLSAQALDILCGGDAGNTDALIDLGRRNVEGGGRIDELRHRSYRAVIGMRGDVSAIWSYDIYALYGTSRLSEIYRNDFSRTRLAKALNAVMGPDAEPVCRVNADADPSNDDPACVAYDIFQPGGVTPAQLAYLQIPGFAEGATIERILSASIAGDLGRHGIKLPSAGAGVELVLGGEYRFERSRLRSDAALQSNELAGQGAAVLDASGAFEVRELFAEARLPLLQDMAFAHDLSLEAGYRYSDYDLGFDTHTYKLGLDWAPLPALRFRAGYQRAVRSPNIQELFAQPRVQLDGSSDPCANAIGAAPRASLEQCLRSGVSALQYGNILENPAAQYNALVGGDPSLAAEVSDTHSFGLVAAPGFLPSLAVTVDYYDIRVGRLIDSLGADFILGQCLNSGEPRYCSLVNRAANGSLWLGTGGYIEDPIRNTGSLRTKAVDLSASYRFAMGRAGALTLASIAAHVKEYVTEPLPGARKYDCAGLYGTVCGTPIARWRHQLRGDWMMPRGAVLTLTWRYIGAVDLDASSVNPVPGASVPATDRKLGSRSYLDLSGAYEFSGPGRFGKLAVRLGINNLFDKDPPLLGLDTCTSVFCSGNTYPQVYDTMGRYVFMGLMADF